MGVLASHRFASEAHCAARIALLMSCCSSAEAAHDIEFVAEHLPEAAMDNRYAALPLASSASAADRAWSFGVQAGFATTRSGHLTIEGPLFAAAASRSLGDRWSLGAFAFFDPQRLTGNRDLRPLQTRFAPDTPIPRPVDARFENLDGAMEHYGAGLNVALHRDNGWLGAYRLNAGVLWERVALRDYRFDYDVLAGSAAGTRGEIDFDATYTHVTPFIGMEWPREWTRWAVAPHALLAWPMPKRGVVGHITGPGFDLHGNTADVGEGKHFGDTSLTLGLDVRYLPANVSIDVGALLTQRFLEPLIHDGIETNWLLSCQWRY
jgi:hypothetical protein